MPKKTPIEIRKEELWYKWECLRRNRDFLTDYNSFMGVEPTGPSLSENDLCEKWGLDFVPDSLDTNPLGDADVPVLLKTILEAQDTVTLTVMPKVEHPLKVEWNETRAGFDVRPRGRQPFRKSFITVPKGEKRWVVVLNPKQPLRLILEGIKWLPWEHRKEGAKRKRAKRNIDLRLLVYDRFQKGESIAQIARSLRRPPLTIWRAWLEAHRDIHGVLPTYKKRLRRLTGFNHQTHIKGCETCLNAKSSVEKMCPSMRDYLNQDYVPQRELTRGDTHGATEEKEDEEGQDETM